MAPGGRLELFFLAVRCKSLPRGLPEHKNRPFRSRQGVKIGVFAWEVLRISGNDPVDSKTASEALREPILMPFWGPLGVISDIDLHENRIFSRPRFWRQIWVEKGSPQKQKKRARNPARFGTTDSYQIAGFCGLGPTVFF